MAELSDEEIDAALERGRLEGEHQVRARRVRFDPASRRIVLELTNGCTFSFPPGLAQGLEAGTAEQLAAVEILGTGRGLHWPQLDTDLFVPGLLAGQFGARGRNGAARQHRATRRALRRGLAHLHARRVVPQRAATQNSREA